MGKSGRVNQGRLIMVDESGRVNQGRLSMVILYYPVNKCSRARSGVMQGGTIQIPASALAKALPNGFKNVTAIYKQSKFIIIVLILLFSIYRYYVHILCTFILSLKRDIKNSYPDFSKYLLIEYIFTFF